MLTSSLMSTEADLVDFCPSIVDNSLACVDDDRDEGRWVDAVSSALIVLLLDELVVVVLDSGGGMTTAPSSPIGLTIVSMTGPGSEDEHADDDEDDDDVSERE